jgi:hypothetical protein
MLLIGFGCEERHHGRFHCLFRRNLKRHLCMLRVPPRLPIRRDDTRGQLRPGSLFEAESSFEFSQALQATNVIASANALAIDKNVGHRAEACNLFQVSLHVTVPRLAHLVKFEDDRFRTSRRNDTLCPRGVGSVRFGEDDEAIAADN